MPQRSPLQSGCGVAGQPWLLPGAAPRRRDADGWCGASASDRDRIRRAPAESRSVQRWRHSTRAVQSENRSRPGRCLHRRVGEAGRSTCSSRRPAPAFLLDNARPGPGQPSRTSACPGPCSSRRARPWMATGIALSASQPPAAPFLPRGPAAAICLATSTAKLRAAKSQARSSTAVGLSSYGWWWQARLRSDQAAAVARTSPVLSRYTLRHSSCACALQRSMPGSRSCQYCRSVSSMACRPRTAAVRGHPAVRAVSPPVTRPSATERSSEGFIPLLEIAHPLGHTGGSFDQHGQMLDREAFVRTSVRVGDGVARLGAPLLVGAAHDVPGTVAIVE